VSLLAEAGIQSAHWSTIGAANAADVEIMAYASANGYVVLRHDLDFSAILAATRGEKPSVAQIRADDLSLDAIGKQVVAALKQMAPGWKKAHCSPSIEPSRLRILPLQSKA